MEKYEELLAAVASLREDLEKLFLKGNKSAGTRARAIIQEVRRIGFDIRAEVQEAKRAIGNKRK